VQCIALIAKSPIVLSHGNLLRSFLLLKALEASVLKPCIRRIVDSLRRGQKTWRNELFDRREITVVDELWQP
jgi:hypothetical protein